MTPRFKGKHDRALYFFGDWMPKTRIIKACRKKDEPEEDLTLKVLMDDYDSQVIEKAYRNLTIEPQRRTRAERHGEAMRYGVDI